MKPIVLGLTLVVAAFTGCNTNRPIVESAMPKVNASAPQEPETQRYIDFSVKGIRLGDTEQNLVKIFGKPQKRVLTNEDVCGVAPMTKLQDPGIEFWLDRGTGGTELEWAILEFTVTSSDFLIEPGIKVGEELDTVKQKLGTPWTQESDGESVLYHYLTKDNDNTSLEFKNGKLVRIRVYINPC